MAGYSIRITSSAAREIDALEPGKLRSQVLARIAALADDPLPAGALKLSGQDKYHLRQGVHRILYQILDAEGTVFIVKVAHHRDVYRPR